MASGLKTLMVLVRPKADSWPEIGAESNKNLNQACEVGLEECTGPNQACVASGPKSRSGVCRCQDGFETVSGQCTAVSKPKPEKVEVQVYSQNITLPANKVMLTAYAIPEPVQSNIYNYEWTLISNNTGGVMENSHNQTLVLSQLIQGIYSFKVTVSGGNPPVLGQGFGNVTVFPRKFP